MQRHAKDIDVSIQTIVQFPVVQASPWYMHTRVSNIEEVFRNRDQILEV